MPRPQLSTIQFSLICSLLFIVFYNNGFWTVFLDNTGLENTADWAFLVTGFLVVTAWVGLVPLILSAPFTTKPVAIFMFLAGALASYYNSTYGVIIDTEMVVNALQTDPAEAADLMSWGFFGYLALYFLLPTVVISWVRIRYHRPLREIGTRLLALVIALVIIFGGFLAFNKDFTFLVRQHTELRGLLTPTHPISSAWKAIRGESSRPTVVLPIAEDATRIPYSGKPRLFVLVVGETARAANFSLNGYQRETNPLLSKAAIINFPNTSACGTSTAQSLPCMFSHLARDDYSRDKAAGFQNLLDVVSRVGINSQWIDNNSGCKGVCDPDKTLQIRDNQDPKLCPSGECFDEILVQSLEQHLSKQQAGSDIFIVLHQKGSHGPAYYKRVPDRFRQFTPECRKVNLQDCSRDSVVNSYDNTILYTDYFLVRLIKALKQTTDSYDPVMLYQSDHGESLGENGLYLHGFPYAIAPAFQTQVPFVIWIPEDSGLANRACLQQKNQSSYSHDILFHSVLGALGIQTSYYQAKLDIFASCRP